MLNPSSILSLVQLEIKKMEPELAARINKYLVSPYCVEREWDYEVNTFYPCWTVLEHLPSCGGIAYCEFGFGPQHPWGLVTLPGGAGRQDMGDSTAWFSSLEEAFRDSWASLDT